MTCAKGIPEGSHTVTPHLIIRGAADAIEFYKKAFNAQEITRMAMPDGKLMHAAIQIGDSRIMLADEWPEWGSLSPQSLNGSPVTLHLYVEDVDSLFHQAVQAGAKVTMPLGDQFWGDRYGQVADPFGHRWSLASRLKEMTPQEMHDAAQKAMAEMPSPS